MRLARYRGFVLTIQPESGEFRAVSIEHESKGLRLNPPPFRSPDAASAISDAQSYIDVQLAKRRGRPRRRTRRRTMGVSDRR